MTFGSPCQDLSVAGKRAGLKHTENGDEETTRSGLFMEPIRIIKEMRYATDGLYPTFAVWENVPGAFSSNKGEDFRVVLEELARIKGGAEITIPKPDKWRKAGCIEGDGWSIAWRTVDAQHWGVPQRRKRIYLVADFRGQRAAEILFEREGLRGHPAQGGETRKTAATDTEGSTGADDKCIAYAFEPGAARRLGGYVNENITGTLRAEMGDNQVAVAYGVQRQLSGVEVQEELAPTILAAAGESGNNKPLVAYMVENHPADSRVKIDESGTCQTLTSRMGTGGGNVPMVLEKEQYLFENHSQDTRYKGPLDVCPIISATFGMGGNNQPFVVEKQNEPVAYNGENITSPQNKANPQPGDPCHTLGTDSRNYLVCLETFHCNVEDNKSPILKARDYKDPHVVCYWDGGQVTGTLTANNAGGTQRMPDKENFTCVIQAEHVAYGLDRASFNQGENAQFGFSVLEEQVPTMIAKGPGAVAHPTEQPQGRYIVRRLTPTECARLQGFPDKWGHPNKKESLTDEEYLFWLDVRNTHARINGKTEKQYSPENMLKWYNKLHTDSSEYKMWGNGIALPNAPYVMQGIAKRLKEGDKDGNNTAITG